MNATITINIGIFNTNAMAATYPPSANEPVSPINTFAGYELNPKNPKQAPAVAAASIATSEFDIDTANSTKKHDTIKVTPDASPSSPSVKFTAFTVPIMNIIINGIYHIPKLIIWFVNGITSCVALGDALY